MKTFKAAGAASADGGVSLKQVLGWGALAFVIWWILVAPTDAAHLVHNIGTFLTTSASGFSHFIGSI